MKQRNLATVLFTFLLIMLTISSCKKDDDVQANGKNKTEVADKIKTVSIDVNGIATITTVNGNLYTQDVAVKSSKGILSTSSVSSNGDSTAVFTLPAPIIGPKSGGGPTTNLLPGGGGTTFQPIIAYVTSVNGFATVRLSNYSQSSNGTTQNVTVYGVVSYGDGGSFFVQYERFGVGGYDSFSIEYFFHF
jgi:hypothetical protein